MPSRKQNATPQERLIWSDLPEETTTTTTTTTTTMSQEAAALIPRATQPGQYDMEGLMTDFPTAKELERFVFDETGLVLNLKGRANRLKYQVAMDVLNGQEVDPTYVGGDNPYIDRADMVPVEEIKEPPARDPSIPDRSHVQNSFHSRAVPHPDPDFRNTGRRCDVTFRKYDTGLITYEILGPIDQRPEGEKLDKFGRLRPEIIRWVDPRTGEQIVQRPDGTLTPVGKRLRALMMSKPVNNTNQWEVWIDREFISRDGRSIQNPWDV